MGNIGATLVLLTGAGILGLIILNPAVFTDLMKLATAAVTNSFRFASGKVS